jgi:methionyl-tRNA formyltransferase
VKALDLLAPTAVWRGTIGRLAARYAIPSRVVANVNAPEYVERIRGLAPDLLVSVAASQIFKRELLSVPRLGCVNVHTGPLPAYRGMLPVFWQMHNGERAITITIHTMTRAIDLGEILSRTEVPVTTGASLDTTIRTMKRAGARALHELLGRYRAGTVTRAPMEPSRGSYRSFPTRVDAVAFRRAGGRLL